MLMLVKHDSFTHVRVLLVLTDRSILTQANYNRLTHTLCHFYSPRPSSAIRREARGVDYTTLFRIVVFMAAGDRFLQLPSAVTSTVDHPLGSAS
jgi:hypothetical protein